jgi:phage tail protein X
LRRHSRKLTLIGSPNFGPIEAMPFTKLSPFNYAAIALTADRSVQGVGWVRPLQTTPVAACALGLLLLVPVATFALELGEASIKSGLGESLLVEIPYRLAADERLTSACVGLVPAAQAADALPTYGRVSRISITSTHIEIFDARSVREPLIGLNVDVHCGTGPRFVRSYQLFVDPPVQAPTILSNGTQVAGARKQSAIDAAALVATTPPNATRGIRNGTATTATLATAVTTPATSDPTASTSITRTARAPASPRARGHVGGNLTQGQTYRVVRGDTLSGIAARIAERPTIRQTADAIFAANPKAFTRGNPDLIEAGRSITIPNMPPATVTLTAASTPAPLPAARAIELPTAAPVPTVNAVPAPTSTTPPLRAEDSASVVAPVAIEPRPAAAAVVEPNAVPVSAATRTDLAPEAPSPATTGRSSAWLIPLLALGVLVLLSAPLAFVRRRKQQAAAQAGDKVKKSSPRRLVDPVAGIDVVEGPLAHHKTGSISSAKVEPVADSGVVMPDDFSDLALAIGTTDSVDLDVGAPVMMDERIDWFADRADGSASNATVGDETIEENAATIRMPDLDAALTVRQQSPQSKPDHSNRATDDDQMTLTIVELEALRQDYEAERTLTQQASQALRDAVAELKATQAARAATAETSTLEIPQQLHDEATDDAANSQTARVRVK